MPQNKDSCNIMIVSNIDTLILGFIIKDKEVNQYYLIMTKLYGIKNCDTVKKAMKWLMDNGVEYQFHDYKKDGVDEVKLTEFVKKFGWEKLLNRKGATWRQLSEQEQNKIMDDKSALELMKEKPSIIKRPIIDFGSKQLIGFDVGEYEDMFGKAV